MQSYGQSYRRTVLSREVNKKIFQTKIKTFICQKNFINLYSLLSYCHIDMTYICLLVNMYICVWKQFSYKHRLVPCWMWCNIIIFRLLQIKCILYDVLKGNFKDTYINQTTGNSKPFFFIIFLSPFFLCSLTHSFLPIYYPLCLDHTQCLVFWAKCLTSETHLQSKITELYSESRTEIMCINI